MKVFQNYMTIIYPNNKLGQSQFKINDKNYSFTLSARKNEGQTDLEFWCLLAGHTADRIMEIYKENGKNIY